jgi:hypothetical protein
MNTIRLPIKFKHESFEMETIPDESDEYYATLIGLAIQIEPGELPISTFYGTKDPTFDNKQVRQVGVQVGNLIPDIRVTSVEVIPNNNGQSNLAIKFERI